MTARIEAGLDRNKMMGECLTATPHHRPAKASVGSRSLVDKAIHTSNALAWSSLLTAASGRSGIADG